MSPRYLALLVALLLTSGCASSPRASEASSPPPAACRDTPFELPGASALADADLELEPFEEWPVIASQVQGCLAAPGSGPARGRAHPPLSIDDHARLRVVPLPGGAVVTWRVLHSCCGAPTSEGLSEVAPQVTLEPGQITLSLPWEGQPCECRCESIVRTRLALPAGRYRLSARPPHGSSPSLQHPDLQIPRRQMRE